MQVAARLAEKGGRAVAPNPKVGCIIVKRGQIIGRGWHKEFGGPHAEQMALEEAAHKARDAIMYVTLEPCSHWGKTPPCTELIVKAGVHEVVIGSKDPNPEIKGYDILKLRGLKTRIGVLKETCDKFNEPYFKYITTKLPFVTLKAGMTLDGKIATARGKSKYITSQESLKRAHQLRAEIGVVMVGITTVLKDNPLLDARLVKGQDTIKLIVDSKLKIPPRAKVLANPETVIIAHTKRAPKGKQKQLLQKGVRLISTPGPKVQLRRLMKAMADSGHINILLEGGSDLNAAMIKDKLVDKMMLFTSPKILGGDALSVVGKLDIKDLGKAIQLNKVTTEKVGKDILVQGYL